MSTAWVGGSVRAKALARRRLGAAGARALATSPDLAEALSSLAQTPYGHDVRVEQSLAEAQRATAAAFLWHLRVLGGWVPREATDMLRTLAGPFEIANVDEHVRELRGEPSEPPFRMGTLATAWGRLAGTSSLAELRETLATSAWGDLGEDTAAAVHVGMRLSWAARVAAVIPRARPWAAGAIALLVARETIVAGRRLSDPLVLMTEPLLGPAWTDARMVRDLNGSVPASARWALADVDRPEDLWRAEAEWWHRVEHDGFALLRRAEFSAAPVLGAVAVLAADAWRVRAALETADRGGGPLEVFDVLA